MEIKLGQHDSALHSKGTRKDLDSASVLERLVHSTCYGMYGWVMK